MLVLAARPAEVVDVALLLLEVDLDPVVEPYNFPPGFLPNKYVLEARAVVRAPARDRCVDGGVAMSDAAARQRR